MGQIIIRKMSDETLEALRLRAGELQLPLEAYVRKVLDKAAQEPTRAATIDALAKLERLWSLQTAPVDSSGPLLRAERDNAGR